MGCGGRHTHRRSREEALQVPGIRCKKLGMLEEQKEDQCDWSVMGRGWEEVGDGEPLFNFKQKNLERSFICLVLRIH